MRCGARICDRDDSPTLAGCSERAARLPPSLVAHCDPRGPAIEPGPADPRSQGEIQMKFTTIGKFSSKSDSAVDFGLASNVGYAVAAYG